MPHSFQCHVYYEDTDLAGIVYYANYLRYIERARTEYVRALGIDQTQVKRDDGIVFAVRRVEADYLSPAFFDDDLTVRTTPIGTTAARILLKQEVFRSDTLLFSANVTLVALSETGKPERIPAKLRQSIGSTTQE